MRIAVTGSIASDHLMTFAGQFSDQLVADGLERISLSFLVDELVVHPGGVAANVAFGLAALGLEPVLVGAAGADFVEHAEWLRTRGVDVSAVHISRTKHTARFICTTDRSNNQVASFYAGAMSEAADIELAPVARRVGTFDFVLISPNDPLAMLRHTDECRALAYPFIADPSQQLARADGEAIRRLVDGAVYLFSNEYEAALLQKKTGWTELDVLERVGSWVVTHGEDGACVHRLGEDVVTVAAARPKLIADPTGAGDAFRAGYLAALAWGLGDLRATQMGCVMASIALEVAGPQEYVVDRDELLRRLLESYGDQCATDIDPSLPPASEVLRANPS